MAEKKIEEFDQRREMLDALKTYFSSNITRHRINIEVLLKNNVGVAEHPDIMQTIEEEMAKLAEYHDKLEMLRVYFKQ